MKIENVENGFKGNASRYKVAAMRAGTVYYAEKNRNVRVRFWLSALNK